MSADILRILVVLIGIGLVAVILVQQPKEGGMSAFTGGGGGASSTVFGSQGSGSFLFKLTGGLALAFVIAISVLVSVTNDGGSDEILSNSTTANTTIPGSENINTNTSSTIPGSKDIKDTTPKGSIPGSDSIKANKDNTTSKTPASNNSTPKKSVNNKEQPTG